LGLGHTNDVYTFTEVVSGWGKIVEVVCGGYHTFIRTEHGKWYAAGGNDDGRLGLGHTNEVYAFTEVTGGWGKIIAVECGRFHTFFRSEHGKLYAVGYNPWGQLGIGHTNNVYVFEEVVGGWGKIVAMDCGMHHSVLRSEDGKWYATGSNNDGRLGVHTNAVCVFTQVAGNLGNIAEMSCGWDHTVLRSVNGKVYAVGGNEYGQLGFGHRNDVSTFTEVVGDWGNIAEMSCGNVNTILRSEHDKWYAAGWNDFGQLGLGHTDDVSTFTEVGVGWLQISKIICGSNHTFLIKE
jgi:alpha-tubulin suppressor-like RCC1 family protein